MHAGITKVSEKSNATRPFESIREGGPDYPDRSTLAISLW
jgi:hypothetical protein